MALCVIFNNNLNFELLAEQIDKETRMIIEKTCEACRLNRSTSPLVLLDELNSLEHTCIKKEQGVFKNKNMTNYLTFLHTISDKRLSCV